MDGFIFYIKLGFNHVMDPGAYDHVLFLFALALPFKFKQWKAVLVLVTIFTVAHCLSLAMAVYGLLSVPVAWVEFLIPITILATAVYNCLMKIDGEKHQNLGLHGAITAFFGLIHGFGFSNYFRMLMADEPEKFWPLLGFATGIEISQVVVIFAALFVSFMAMDLLRVNKAFYIRLFSILIGIITIPMIVKAFP
ncbi:MAG: HupE/UreJ family protein [Flavobacteriaceae bacterium]|nr:HupE/UreJ family protein [Flavobacteriaceae bacterium]